MGDSGLFDAELTAIQSQEAITLIAQDGEAFFTDGLEPFGVGEAIPLEVDRKTVGPLVPKLGFGLVLRQPQQVAAAAVNGFLRCQLLR